MSTLSLAAALVLAFAPGPILWAGEQRSGGHVRLELREQANIAGPFIRVSDLASVRGWPEELRLRAANVRVGLTPVHGKTCTISRARLAACLQNAGLKPRQVMVSGAGTTLVSNSGTSKAPANSAASQREPLKTRDSKPKGLIRTLVCIRPVARGQQLDASSFELRDVKPARGTSAHGLIRNLSRIKGMRAMRDLANGYRLHQRDLVRRPMVKRNEIVTVEATGPGIIINLTALARESGDIGESIKVENLDSREQFDAMVIGHRRVRVDLAGGDRR